ncbi:MAG: hypothetical protein R2712_04215 [Vicinamibacterales bacterium]
MCGALSRWAGREDDPGDAAGHRRGHRAQVIAVPTGLQDYRPALFGGVAAVELGPGLVRRVAWTWTG